MRADPQLLTFAAGEISPLAMGRIDVQRYGAACRSLVNFIVTPTGGLVHRSGTQYLGGTAANAKALLIPFVANTGSEFILEIADGTTRVWYGPGRRLVYDNAGTWNINLVGSPAALATPWPASALYDTDATPRIKVVQVNDVMWLVHPNYLPQKISRIDDYKFQVTPMGDGINASVPFKDVNPNNAVTVQASAATGAGVTLTASAPLFAASDVGGWFYMERPRADATPPWETNKASALNDVRSSSGRYYIATSAATPTGSVRPTHSYGTRLDGTVPWDWTDDGYGIAAITGFTDTTHVTVTVVRQLPNTVVSGSTTRWAKQAWNVTDGYPTGIALYRERLCFCRNQTLWTSVAGDYENFQFQDGGQLTADMAVTITFGAQRNDRLRWIATIGDVLMAGTASSEFAIGPQSTSEPFGPLNVSAKPLSGYGCLGLQPVPVSESLMFVERGGRRLREARYNIEVDGVASRDLTIFADHIFGRGTCAGLAHQRVPFGVLWSTTVNGQLKGFTYQAEQQVWAWHPHVLGGAGLGQFNRPAVRSLASITSPDGANDDLWMVVERRINNATVYYVEVLGPHLSHTLLGYVNVDDLTDVKDSAFLDCQVQKTLLADATSITGLSHLEDASATPVIDGKLGAAKTVSGGTIAVSGVDDACKAWIGLARDADIIPVPLVGQSGSGASQGKKARISHVTVRCKDSLNFVAGKPGGTLDRKRFRKQKDPMSEATPLMSGDLTVLYPSGSTEDEERPELLIRQDQPFPMVVLGIFPRLTVAED